MLSQAFALGSAFRQKAGTKRTSYIMLVRCFTDRTKPIDSLAVENVSNSHHIISSGNKTDDLAIRRVGFFDLVKSKLYEAQTLYDDFSGMSEVKMFQQKVIEIQENLQLVQERRRHILLELTLVRKQLQDIHIELQKTSRGEHRYVELVKQEFDIIGKEREKNEIFQIFDQQERELFSHLTSAVKTSHEKERTQANNVKYWSIIASGIGALLGIVATSINFFFRNNQYAAIIQAAEVGNAKLLVVEKKLTDLEASLTRMNVEWSRYLVTQSAKEKRVMEQRAMEQRSGLRPTEAQRESWWNYLRRHTSRILRYLIP